MKKTQRQVQVSVIQPPSVGPRMGAAMIPRLQKAMALPCSLPGNSSSSTACDSGCSAAAGQALDDAEDDQHGQVERQPAEQARERKSCHGQQQQPLAAEHARHPPRDGQNDGVGHQVGGQHPGGLFRARGQRAGDVRQADVDHRGVQHLHHGAGHDGDGGHPAMGKAGSTSGGRPRRAEGGVSHGGPPFPERLAAAKGPRPGEKNCAVEPTGWAGLSTANSPRSRAA